MIDKRTLEFILTDQQDELRGRRNEELCPRAEEHLIDMASSQAQVVIGVRRSGKSTLCFQVLEQLKKPYAYVNFDDERLQGLEVGQLNDVLEVLYKINGDFAYLFLDEIQNVTGWHLFVNRLLRKKIHLVVTGSNAKLLSGELATHLTGRNKEIPLFPFSFAEYCQMKHVDLARKSTRMEAFRRSAFDEYLRSGGFPELMLISHNNSYVANLFDNIIQRDIEQRYKITYRAAFRRMAHHLLNIVPTVPSPQDLATSFLIKSAHTARNYVEYLKQAFLLIGIQRYSAKSKLRASKEKLYAVDVAMMSQRDNAFAGENLGHRLETIVLMHLMRKSKIEGWDIYFINERSGECDFVVCQNNKVVQAIQVSYDITNPKTKKREIKGLLLAARQTGCENLLLLTDHEAEHLQADGHQIKIQPVYEWCLELGV